MRLLHRLASHIALVVSLMKSCRLHKGGKVSRQCNVDIQNSRTSLIAGLDFVTRAADDATVVALMSAPPPVNADMQALLRNRIDLEIDLDLCMTFEDLLLESVRSRVRGCSYPLLILRLGQMMEAIARSRPSNRDGSFFTSLSRMAIASALIVVIIAAAQPRQRYRTNKRQSIQGNLWTQITAPFRRCAQYCRVSSEQEPTKAVYVGAKTRPKPRSIKRKAPRARPAVQSSESSHTAARNQASEVLEPQSGHGPEPEPESQPQPKTGTGTETKTEIKTETKTETEPPDE